jgi:hypothetical protein
MSQCFLYGGQGTHVVALLFLVARFIIIFVQERQITTGSVGAGDTFFRYIYWYKQWRSQHRVEPGQPTRLSFWEKKMKYRFANR